MSLYHIDTINYDLENSILSVTYAGGSTWKYWPISSVDYKEILTSNQDAKTVHNVIRRGNVIGTKKVVTTPSVKTDGFCLKDKAMPSPIKLLWLQ